MQLRRADVLRGARDLLDADGLDGLTMRKLGAALNVQAGGLYWHFPSKQALLEAVADDLLAGVAETPRPAPGTSASSLSPTGFGRRCSASATAPGWSPRRS
ncbi:TetR/AcrR family transcriptional regulator [Paractinoplanes durhamensis]|uniref:TetR/AcrR family transcriptional regulator n=1 Tax=Paractinoplanes durhamensis TaxID=113563 RepID=UPI00362C0BF7